MKSGYDEHSDWNFDTPRRGNGRDARLREASSRDRAAADTLPADS